MEYPTMTVDELCALKVPAAKDAHCYIWTINAYVEATYRVARAWGFRPVVLLTWGKTPRGIGFGGAFVQTTEHILFCRRGRDICKKRVDSTWWNWPRPEKGTGPKHSRKPEAFQNLVESVSPGPYLEMFARRQRPGWSVWGNQVACDSELVRSGGGGGVLVGDSNATTRNGAGSQNNVSPTTKT
jgi:N6-adenosine-specific RNA methylase IME4